MRYAEVLAARGCGDALVWVRPIARREDRIDGLLRVAARLAERGDRPRATACLQEALQQIREGEIARPWSAEEEARHLAGEARVRLALGEPTPGAELFAAARAAAEGAVDPGGARLHVLRSSLECGRLQEALALWRAGVPVDWTHEAIRADLAVQLEAAGEEAAASEVLRPSLSEALTMERPAIERVLQRCLADGRVDRAIALVASMPARFRASWLAFLARELVARDHPALSEVLERWRRDGRRAGERLALAAAAGDESARDEASRRAAASDRDPKQRAIALAVLGRDGEVAHAADREATPEGSVSAICEAVERAYPSRPEATALLAEAASRTFGLAEDHLAAARARIALAHTRCGLRSLARDRFAEARAAASKIRSVANRRRGVLAILEAEVEAGLFDDALRTCRKLPRGHARNEGLLRLGRRLGERGDVGSAIATLERIGDPPKGLALRAECAVDLLFACVTESRRARARRSGWLSS
ncbi:MAG TPA: hypothetical protein RMH99_32515 [Sandaracinaceae bacterium LLY-WYZ-13_1]|nr:hypothetical protein [Sandaracinaceae bacterium LLY-WYZ-13_1]